MKIKTVTLLVVICLIISLMIDMVSLAQNMSHMKLTWAIKPFLQIPMILFFATLWHRQKGEEAKVDNK